MRKEFSLKNDSIDFEITGNFNPENELEEEIYLYIFNNKQADYEGFKPVFSNMLNFEESDDGFQFNLKESLKMKKGLYYIQIENEAGEILYLGKFLAK